MLVTNIKINKFSAKVMFDQTPLNVIQRMDKNKLASNALFGGIYGGIFGVANTGIIFAVFTLISTNQFMNFYFGGLFLFLGTYLLHRI